MRYIDLPHNEKSIIDDDIYSDFSKYKWFLNINKKYVIRNSKCIKGEKRHTILMHREVLRIKLGISGLFVDHINGDGKDNRLENLRIATNSQNLANRGKYKTNSSGYKGVSPYKRNTKYFAFSAEISYEHNRFYLGRYKYPELAAEAYDEAARILFGEFAWLNFPSKNEKVLSKETLERLKI